MNGVGLIDAWEATTTSGRYTHYTANGASRIDRIYATKEIMERKTGIQTTAAAFTDHNAVIMRITIDTPPTRGRGYWRLNTALMREKSHIDTLQEQWEKWRTHKKHYPNSVMWWDRYTKRMIKKLFIKEGTERRRDRQTMETFYYETIYSILQDETMRNNVSTKLKELKARIVRLHHTEQQQRLLDVDEQDRMMEEQPSIFHIVKARKRQEKKTIHSINDSNGNPQESNATIMRTFTEFMQEKYEHIQAAPDQINQMENSEKNATTISKHIPRCTDIHRRTPPRSPRREET